MVDSRAVAHPAPHGGEILRGGQLLECRIWAADCLYRFPEFGRDDSRPHLAALGEEHAAAKQAHRGDDLRQVRPRVGDRETLVIHRRSVPNVSSVQQDSEYNRSVTSPYKTETRHHPRGKTCHHFTYHGLTCDQYDAMRARANGHCEICGIAEQDTRRGSLVVDHFRGRRTRVIRGMICDTCNASVMQCIDGNKVWGPGTRALEDRARAYDSNPWQMPSEEALQEMAARTEMLAKNDPRRLPTREYVPYVPESRPAHLANLQIPLNRGPAVIAKRLRRHLSAKQLDRLISLLSESE